ncbi:hypothetical protein EX461_18045 [Vibrio parahaemolyticus]|nr:hypothetical protein [Vibrio parahaemolyticus]
MALEYIGYDISKIEPFDTVRGGLVNIRKATKCKTWEELMNKLGLVKINPMLTTNDCILSNGIHRYIYKNGYLFGVHPYSKKFDYFKIDHKDLSLFEVYKWVRHS